MIGPFRSEQITPPMRLIGAFLPESFFDWFERVCFPSAHVLHCGLLWSVNLMPLSGLEANSSIAPSLRGQVRREIDKGYLRGSSDDLALISRRIFVRLGGKQVENAQ